MKEPIVDLKKIAAAGREACFSTKTISKGQMPKILNEYKKLCQKAHTKCATETQDKLKKIEKNIRAWETLKNPKNLKKHFESKINSFLNFTPEKYRTSLKTPYDKYKNREKDYIDFKRQNNLVQEPLRAGFKTWALGLVVVLFGIELYANYQLFQGVTGTLTEAGRRTAWTLSGAQSFVNVFSGFLVGWLLWGKVLYASNLSKKLFALSLALAHAFIIIYMNLSIGLWRAILSSNANGGMQIGTTDTGEPIMRLIEVWKALYPFDYFTHFNGQMDSFLVGLVGMVFALVAYLDGWFSDDSYPKYGATSREVTKSRKILDDSKNELYKKWEDIVNNYNTVTDEFSKKAHDALDVWNDSVNELQKQFVDWEAAILVAEKNYTLVIQTYETAFNQGLPRASEKISLPKDALFDNQQTDPFKVFTDAAAHHKTDTVRMKEFKAQKSDYVTDFNKLSEGWQKHLKDTYSSIHKLVKEFDG